MSDDVRRTTERRVHCVLPGKGVCVCEWVSEWVGEWVSGWVGEWVSEQWKLALRCLW
jgi:hypothetical protein